jgi:hypothetical protein
MDGNLPADRLAGQKFNSFLVEICYTTLVAGCIIKIKDYCFKCFSVKTFRKTGIIKSRIVRRKAIIIGYMKS